MSRRVKLSLQTLPKPPSKHLNSINNNNINMITKSTLVEDKLLEILTQDGTWYSSSLLGHLSGAGFYATKEALETLKVNEKIESKQVGRATYWRVKNGM